MCESNFAERISAFDGTQPVFRQSPPILCFSTSVTLALIAEAIYAVTSPALPAPITTRLRSIRAGFFHAANSLFTRPIATIFRASKGKIPRRTKEPSNAGETIPASESIFASCVPAFT